MVSSHSPSRASEAIELAAFAFGRAARAGLADSDPWQALHHRNGWAVVDEARGGDRGPDPLVDNGDHLEDAFAFDERLDAVADLHRRRRLGRDAVHADMAATARGCRGRTALVEPDGPQPNVHAGRVHSINRAALARAASEAALRPCLDAVTPRPERAALRGSPRRGRGRTRCLR